MLRALHSEYVKLTTRKINFWSFAILITGAIYGPLVLLWMLSSTPLDSEASGTIYLSVYAGGQITVILGIMFGATFYGRDLSTKMLIHDCISLKTRTQYFIAKIIISALYMLILTIIGSIIVQLFSLIAGVEFNWLNDLALLRYIILAPVLCSIIGLGFTALTGKAVIIVFIFSFLMPFVEQIMSVSGNRIMGKIVDNAALFHSLSYLTEGNMGDVVKEMIIILSWVSVAIITGMIANKIRAMR